MKRESSSPGATHRIGVVLLLAALATSTFVRLRVADVPLERDEGEYAYAGRLILDGEPPYRLAYNMKFPGTYYSYAVILAVFGSTPRNIHTGLLVVNIASICLLYLIARRLLDDAAAGVSALVFAVLSLDRWSLGVFAHATHFVVVAALLGLWLLLRAIDDDRLALLAAAGASFGIAVLMKQQGVFFLPAAALYLLWREIRVRRSSGRVAAVRAAILLGGAAVPLAILIVLFSIQGVLSAFWFWTFQYASEYVSQVPLSGFASSLRHGFDAISTRTLGLWLLAGAGATALWWSDWPRATRVLVSLLLVASFLCVCPGFYFRRHYFIAMFPVVALLAAVATVGIARANTHFLARSGGLVAAAVLAAAIAWYAVPEREYLFSKGAEQISREQYGSNPFIESIEIARYIRERTTPADRIAVLGSEPQIYFYSGRNSASGYIYMYPLVEDQVFAYTMQLEMIREIEAAKPAYIVYAKIRTSWLARNQADQKLLRWADEFVRGCYETVGIVDIDPKRETTYVWDAPIGSYQPRSTELVYVFRRKAPADCNVASP